MRLMAWIFVPLAIAAISPALAQSQGEATLCNADNAKSPDEVIGVCSLVIDTADVPGAVRMQALLARAELRRSQQQFDQAIADCNEAIRLDPAAPAGFDCRGNALAGKKGYLRALDDFDRAIRLDPTVVRGFSARGSTFCLIREHRLGGRGFRQGIRRRPDRG